MDVLIIKLGALGDVVRTSFLFEGLAKKRKWNISILTDQKLLELLSHNPFVTNTFCIKDLQKVTLLKFDMIVNLEEDQNTAELVEELRTRHKCSLIGYSLRNNSVDYDRTFAKYFDMGLRSRFGKVKADSLKKQNASSFLEIFAECLELDPIMPNLHLQREITQNHVGIFPFAGNVWPGKSLALNELKLLIKSLEAVQCDFLLFGEDKRLTQYQSKHFRTDSITDLAKVIAKCKVLITADSLAVHLATGTETNTVSFYGPTSAPEIDVTSKSVKVIATEPDYCSYSKTQTYKSLTGERLFEAVRGFI